MHGIAWTKESVNEFFDKACLTDMEKNIIKARINEWSRIQMAMKYNISVSTVDKTISRVMKKYDYCQRNSEILPKREKSIKNIYG